MEGDELDADAMASAADMARDQEALERDIVWQPDLFRGQGKVRPEPKTRAEALAAARAEMRDTNSPTLFEAPLDNNSKSS